MDVEKKRFGRNISTCCSRAWIMIMKTKTVEPEISSVRSDSTAAEKAVSRKFIDYSPGVIDFLRRCDKAEQAEEIICTWRRGAK